MKTYTIGNTEIRVADNTVTIGYKAYPIVTAVIPVAATRLLTRKPMVTLVGAGEVWVTFHSREGDRLRLVFQVEGFTHLSPQGGNLYLGGCSQDF